MSEQERDLALPGATRSQHVVLEGPIDMRTVDAALRPGIERSRGAGDIAAPACLIVCRSHEQVLAAARQTGLMVGPNGGRVVPVTAVARARRVLSSAPVSVVAGTPEDLLELRKDSAIDFSMLQVLVLLALDDLLAAGNGETLQSLIADSPTETMRIATLETDTEEVASFLEAQMRRARRIAAPTSNAAGADPFAIVPQYLLTGTAGRAEALRVLLDAEDPPSLQVIADSDAGIADATAALEHLGVVVDGLNVQVTRRSGAQHVSLVVLWDVPVAHEAIATALAAKPAQAVALLIPEDLPAFIELTNGQSRPWIRPSRSSAAGERVEAVRASLEAVLAARSATAGELALLTPLLDQHDPVELAAAALRLYEEAIAVQRAARLSAGKASRNIGRESARNSSPGNAVSDSPGDRGHVRKLAETAGGSSTEGVQRLFLGIGRRDGIRVGDIVGAIANEAGIAGDRIGQVDLFESHTLVELNSTDMAAAVSALGSVSLRGRRLNARIDTRGDDRGASGRRERGGAGGHRDDFRGERRGSRDGGAGRKSGSGFGGRSSGSPSRSTGSFGGRKSFGSARSDNERGDSRHDRPRGKSRFEGDRRGTGGDRMSRTSEERRSFVDRPIRERVEGRQEWAERGERLKHSKRAVRPRQQRGWDSDED